MKNEPKQSPKKPVNQKYEDPKADRGKTIKFKVDLEIYSWKIRSRN